MATALRTRAAAYDTQPVGEFPNSFTNPVRELVGNLKDACQGACSGFLSLIGATHLTSSPSELATFGSEIDILDNIWMSIAADGLAGPVELLGGIVLFFAARRTISRTIGLLLFIGFIAAYANGYSVVDILTILSELLDSVAGVLEPIPAQ